MGAAPPPGRHMNYAPADVPFGQSPRTAARYKDNSSGTVYGPWNFALVVGCSNPHHHPSCPDLALIMADLTLAGVSRPLSAGHESSHSAVSWPAIIAGAFAALAISVVLASLGAGLGLTSISAWPNVGASATTFTISAGIGLIVVQWLSAALGGYITGRLRTKWTDVHTHEVFFRDTANGFLSWALATIVGTVLLGMAASSIAGGGVRTATTVGEGAAQGATSGVSGYAVDGLFRSDRVDASANNQDVTAQATRILAT